MAIRDFRDLDVWQLAVDLAVDVYELTARFPEAELFGLTSQLRRSAVSVSSNIAEGNGRGTRKDYARCLMDSKSSLNEVRSQLHVSTRLGFAPPIDAERIEGVAERVAQMLMSLRRKLLLPKVEKRRR